MLVRRLKRQDLEEVAYWFFLFIFGLATLCGFTYYSVQEINGQVDFPPCAAKSSEEARK